VEIGVQPGSAARDPDAKSRVVGVAWSDTRQSEQGEGGTDEKGRFGRS